MPPMHQNVISRLPFASQKSFTTHFSPDTYRKKTQYLLCHKNLMKGNKTANN